MGLSYHFFDGPTKRFNDVGMFVFIIYGVVAAVMVVQGTDFRYVLIGNRFERYLQQEQ